MDGWKAEDIVIVVVVVLLRQASLATARPLHVCALVDRRIWMNEQVVISFARGALGLLAGSAGESKVNAAGAAVVRARVDL